MAMKDAQKTLGNLIDHQKVAYIASVDGEGFPEMRAMLMPRKREGIKTFWFSTNTSSSKVEQYRQNPKASIYFCDRRFFRGVLLVGTMEVLQDAESRRLIWEKGDTQYYPLGVDDPDYSVLRFTATSGKYYSSFKVERFTP